jgi:hypothetical protein
MFPLWSVQEKIRKAMKGNLVHLLQNGAPWKNISGS